MNMNQYMAKHRIDHIDMEKWDKFLKAANLAAESLDTSMCGVKNPRNRNYMREYARDSYRFHHYPVTVPRGPIWTGRKR